MINKLCGLFALLFGVLFTSLFGLSSGVSAASAYDDAYHTAEHYYVSPASRLQPEFEPEYFDLGIDEVMGFIGTYVTSAGLTRPADFNDFMENPDNFAYSLSAIDSLEPGYNAGTRSIQLNVFEKNTPLVFGTISSGRPAVYVPQPIPQQAHKFSLVITFNPSEPPGSAVVQFGIFTDASIISHLRGSGVVDMKNYVAVNFNITYPEGYAGLPINEVPGGTEKEFLKPDYEIKWTEGGKLNVKYLQSSLPHFLTGISYVVVEKMNEDWDGIDENLTSHTENPAGFLNWDYQLPGKGYYMVRIDHNQQLDSPPWPHSNYDVNQWYVQFYYDGMSAGYVTTVGKPPGMIVNDIKNPDSLYNTIGDSGAGLLEGSGLLAFIMAPLEFIKILPQKAANCEPITFPLFGSDEQLPCVSPMLKSSLPVLVTIIQTSMWAFVIYGIAFNLFRLTRDVQNPQKDGIEVTKL